MQSLGHIQVKAGEEVEVGRNCDWKCGTERSVCLKNYLHNGGITWALLPYLACEDGSRVVTWFKSDIYPPKGASDLPGGTGDFFSGIEGNQLVMLALPWHTLKWNLGFETMPSVSECTASLPKDGKGQQGQQMFLGGGKVYELPVTVSLALHLWLWIGNQGSPDLSAAKETR